MDGRRWDEGIVEMSRCNVGAYGGWVRLLRLRRRVLPLTGVDCVFCHLQTYSAAVSVLLKQKTNRYKNFA